MKSGAKEYLLRAIKTLILPVVVYVFFTIVGQGNFGTLSGMMVMTRQACMSIILAFALAFNMSMGIWDFSAGAVVYLSAILGGNLALRLNMGVLGLILCCLIVGVLLATLTGALYRFMKVPSIVLTVGLVLVYESITCIVYGSNGVLITGDMTKLYQVPYCFIILVVMIVIFYIVYNYTAFGHNVRALGNGQVVARNAGLSPSKIKFKSFIFGGLFLGASALLFISQKGRVAAVSSMQSVTLVFDAMMGIFIGMFLSKYCNLTFGIAIGAFTMKMLNAGLVAMGLSSNIRNITSGIFLLIVLIISNNQGILERIRNTKKKAELANEHFKAAQKQ